MKRAAVLRAGLAFAACGGKPLSTSPQAGIDGASSGVDASSTLPDGRCIRRILSTTP